MCNELRNYFLLPEKSRANLTGKDKNLFSTLIKPHTIYLFYS